MEIPKSHPRYKSLMKRERVVKGVENGMVVLEGLIAHGRGEAFDYLIGEKTTKHALIAEKTAVAHIITAKNPVLSINGNTAVLAGKHIVEFAKITGAKIEVNLFYRTEARVKKLCEFIRSLGAERVLGEVGNAHIPGLEHPRGICAMKGIYRADVVLLALEDGDRTEALKKMGKTVIAIDLNPLSRTARTADVTIVDDVERAYMNMCALAMKMKVYGTKHLEEIKESFDNENNLREILRQICKRFE